MSSYLRALSASVSLLALLVSGPALANAYSDLSAMDKAYVERLCAPIQYKQDVSAYRNCVAEQSAAVHKYNRTPISSLDFDEQYSVQQVCQNEGAIGSTLYRQCVVTQARSLLGTQPADVSSLSDEQVYIAKQDCADSTQGVKSYRLCLNDAVAALNDPAIPTGQSKNVVAVQPATALPNNKDLNTASPLIDYSPTYEVALEPKTNDDPTPGVQPSNRSMITATAPDEQTIDELADKKILKLTKQTELITSSRENQANNDQLAIELTLPNGQTIEEIDTEVFTLNELQSDKLTTDVATSDISPPVSPTPTKTITLVPAFAVQAINEPEITAVKPDKSTVDPLISEVPALVNQTLKQALPAAKATDELIPVTSTTQSVTASTDEIRNTAENSTSKIPAALAIQVGTNSTQLPSETSTTLKSTDSTLQITKVPSPNAQLTESLPPQLSAAESVTTNDQDAEADAQEPANTDDLDPVNSQQPPLEVAKDTAQRLWNQLLASLEGVQGMDRIILLCALALPFLLIGFWLVMRRSSDDSDSYDSSHLPEDRSRGNAVHSMHDDTADTSNDTLDAKQVQYADQVEELFADDEDPVFTDTASTDIPEESTYMDLAETANEDTYHTAPPSALAAILVDHEKANQLGFVIEFMIYWMAFTDERYEPTLKTKIFAIEEPDEHDLIKRSVLNHDVDAFADATSWLQENASKEERVQIIKLLMALLVYEEGVTPVQNTLLRFLSNAFGLTHIQLDALFQTAFGHELPPMPRPDKPTWWNKQSSDKLKRWDARSVAMQTPSIQARVKLGLPLTGDLDPQQISETHERAILRCEAKNFDLLTTREQQLAEGQQAKYHNALDTLVEITK